MTASLPNSRDTALQDRARRVIPNGMWGHIATRSIAPGYPQFFSRADGCRVWDADGNEYIDFMCAWGPNVLGYHHEAVDAAALAQLQVVDSGNGPTETLVWLPPVMQGVFSLNGSDRVQSCVRPSVVAVSLATGRYGDLRIRSRTR
ncbi:MAG: aminotransferase class III-fold pyridoxal phosphate-dependent enzyme [Paracoccaceae bacterium]